MERIDNEIVQAIEEGMFVCKYPIIGEPAPNFRGDDIRNIALYKVEKITGLAKAREFHLKSHTSNIGVVAVVGTRTLSDATFANGEWWIDESQLQQE